LGWNIPIMGQKKAIKSYRISVVGCGHVGLVTGVSLAELGHKVICIDNNQKKVKSLNSLKLPFYEPGLYELFKKNFEKKSLKFTHSLVYAVKNSEVIFIAVGTPSNPDGSADLSAIENVSYQIARSLNSYKLIVEKSTVPVQTGFKVKETIIRFRKNNTSFDIASNPEFLREGKALYDFFYPARIVIGVESKRAEKILKEIYAPLKAKIVVTDINTAELIKHASNSFLATKISFMNAVARICDLAGADVKKVSEAVGLDPRIGGDFLNAGIGWGGSCFPKDLEAFRYISKKLGYDFSLLEEVKRINNEQKIYFVEKVKESLWILKDKKIAVLGLSFKPDTDDLRNAPSLDIIESFLQEGAKIVAYDPQANKEAKKIFGKRINFAKDAYEAAKSADCLCLLTEWKEFKNLDFIRIKKLMRVPIIADGRNMFERKDVEKLGFTYIGIGR